MLSLSTCTPPISIADRVPNGNRVAMEEYRSVGDLLPGIFDHIVLDEIVPKLRWEQFYILSCVSRAWYDAIRSHQVFKSRALSHSSDALIGFYARNGISLYSMEENSWYKLPFPPYPHRPNRIPQWARCISMDGRIYVLGGVMGSATYRNVFVFDLAGLGHWKQCASMIQPRGAFASTVKDGKIYVFGGRTIYQPNFYTGVGRELLCDAEVYDPNKNTWSPITPMNTCCAHQLVTQIGEEVFVQGSRIQYTRDSDKDVHFLDAYHTVKNDWRVVQHDLKWPSSDFSNSTHRFTAQGSFFACDPHEKPHEILLAIRKYDVDGNSWTHLRSFSLAPLLPVHYHPLGIDAILVVDDELVVLFVCERIHQSPVFCLLQSQGFGGENPKISWTLRTLPSCNLDPRLHDVTNYFVQKL